LRGCREILSNRLEILGRCRKFLSDCREFLGHCRKFLRGCRKRLNHVPRSLTCSQNGSCREHEPKQAKVKPNRRESSSPPAFALQTRPRDSRSADLPPVLLGRFLLHGKRGAGEARHSLPPLAQSARLSAPSKIVNLLCGGHVLDIGVDLRLRLALPISKSATRSVSTGDRSSQRTSAPSSSAIHRSLGSTS